jgi:pimeloyl-ACP methyl ester carboxylesterase
LNYLGFSYGTQLGATYAGLFPDRVGRLVLDGAIDVTLSADESSLQQAVGFENALRAYVANCQFGPNCPLHGSVDDGMHQIRQLLDAAIDQPLPTGSSRDLTQTLMFYGIAVTLYDQESWPILTEALDEAINRQSGATLLWLADFYNERNPDGADPLFRSNSTEAFLAVGCLDERGTTDPTEMAAEAARIEQAAPTMGSFFGYGGLVCENWPAPLVPIEFDQTAPGAAPIMVIGTTGDPATPYAWAQALSNTLESGFLVSYEGEGHTAYSRAKDGGCIMNAVDDFLVGGVIPPAGLRC